MLFRKTLRTIKLYKAQFISMIIMIAIGVGVFIGFNIEWFSIDKNTTKFFDETNFADYRIFTDSNITDEDFEKIKNLDGVSAASKYLSVTTTVKGTNKTIALSVTSNFDVSSFKLIGDGQAYDEKLESGIWISDSYAKHNNLKIGDFIELQYSNYTFKEKIIGLIKAGEYLICVPSETQLMPDYNTHGYAYITPNTLKKHLGSEVYSQVNLKSTLSKQDALAKIEEVLGKRVVLLSKDDTISYAEAQGESQEGKTMASILPVLFLIIATLTMITTMHRVSINEKQQIGILKALGFKNKTILLHYTMLSTLVGVLGVIIGIGMGYLLALYIMNPKGAMGTYMDMPYWKLYMPWFCIIVVIGILVLLSLVGYFSIKRLLVGNVSETLRPYTPKRIKPLLIEKTKIWKKLGFGVKWNTRDIMRHKVRSLMTLFGVFGCTILIIASLGMQDTMNDFVDVFYDEAINYKTKITTTSKCSNEQAIALSEEYEADYASITTVKIKEKSVSLETYDIKYDRVKFLNEDAKTFKLADDGVYICNRIVNEYGYKKGDYLEFTLIETNETYKVKIAGIVRSLTEAIIMTKTYAEEINYNYKINTLYTNVEDIAGNELIQDHQSKSNIIKSFDTFMNLMYIMVFLLIVVALILGAVVLYNLGVMSYMERYREMATLKVVGFKNKKIGNLLISQNLWITIVGVILGLPTGVYVLKFLIVKLASEYEMVCKVNFLTYLVTTVLIIALSLLVSLFIARKNKKINMVESLKGIE